MTSIVWHVMDIGSSERLAFAFKVEGTKLALENVGFVKRRFLDNDFEFDYRGPDELTRFSLEFKRWPDMLSAMLAVQEYFEQEQETLEGSI